MYWFLGIKYLKYAIVDFGSEIFTLSDIDTGCYDE